MMDHDTHTPPGHIDPPERSRRAGFTLIELSIVLVIIGLIIGGVMVGRELIQAARIRAQITQIERINTAVHTFQVKYNAIPGDMQASVAADLGIFATRAGTEGQGDGNGLIQASTGWNEACGEILLFWNDLSTVGLIPGHFQGTDGNVGSNTCQLINGLWPNELPNSIMGGPNSYLYAESVSGINYIEIANISSMFNNGVMGNSGSGSYSAGSITPVEGN